MEYKFTFYSKIRLRKQSYIAYFSFEPSSNEAWKSPTTNIGTFWGERVWFVQRIVGLVP
jgi:hypothetical protein